MIRSRRSIIAAAVLAPLVVTAAYTLDTLAQATPPHHGRPPHHAPPPHAHADAGAAHHDAGDAAAPAPTACNFVGTWEGTYTAGRLVGSSFEWRINADGTAQGVIRVRNSPMTVPQTWSLQNGVLSITDQGFSGRACPATGTYNLTFASGCAGATLRMIADPCNDRATSVNGLAIRRR